jgi:hypothetical protein
MKLSKYVPVVMLAGLCSVAPAFAGDNTDSKLGFGFHGVVVGNALNAASLRGWSGKLGWEANALYGKLEVSPKGGSSRKADAFGLELKGLYTLVSRSNSQLYAGAKFAYIDAKEDLSGDLKAKVYQPGVLVGSEFCIPQLPEVRFDFEVGYNYAWTNNVNKLDLKAHGVNVGLGIHYNF